MQFLSNVELKRNAGNELKRSESCGVGKAGLYGAFDQIGLVPIPRHRRHSVETSPGRALYGLSDMTIDIKQHRWDRWHDVGAVNQAEGEIAKPRRIVVEKFLTAVARAAEGIDDDLWGVLQA